MEENKEKKYVMHIVSLVLGIISIVTSLFWYMSIPTSILAIIFGTKTARKTGTKIGKAGLITGIVGISITVFMYLSALIIILVQNM